MSLRERVYTIDDLRALESLPENADKRFELLSGVIYEVPYSTPLHNLIVGNICFPLSLFVKARKLGYAFMNSVAYTLLTGDEFAPDVSFVARDRIPDPIPKRFPFAPDMAVEVASPSNRERELLDKAESMLESGTQFVWIVYPTKKVVDVCHLAEDGTLHMRTVRMDESLDGEEALPGFTLAVNTIFDLNGD